jgi:hypothetical protein
MVLKNKHKQNRESSVDSETGYGWTPGFDTRQGQEIFLYSTASRRTLGPTHRGATEGSLSRGLKRLWREAGHSPQSNGKTENG